MKKIVHISDLHFGAEDLNVLRELLENINNHNPNLVIISGDLTQRAKSEQYEDAADFLAQIKFPKIVVPGNHDISLWNLFRRFFNPLQRFKKYIHDDEFPFYEDNEITIVGINSARSLTIMDGRVSLSQIQHLKNIFCNKSEPQFKAIVIHHNLIPSTDIKSHKILGRAGLMIAELNDCGIDMIFSGHLHKYQSEDVQKYFKGSNSIIISQAGTATSSRTRGEKNSYNYVEVFPSKILINIMRFNGEKFIAEKEIVYNREQIYSPG